MIFKGIFSISFVIVLTLLILRPRRICIAYRCRLLLHLLWCVRSVGLLETFVIHAKTAEPIEVQFGVWTRMGPSTDILDGGLDPAR